MLKMEKASYFLFWSIVVFVKILICHATKQPNIVFILTDDQDVEIGGMDPMKKTKELIGNAGITFQNSYVTTPLCCPSRSSILTGNYVHNHRAVNNSISGNCSSPAWQQGPEKIAFPTYLKTAKYDTFFAGKYLNQYGYKPAGGVAHVPPGWSDWNGLVGNSAYYNYELSANGKVEKHAEKYSEDYLTDVIHKKATDFIEGRGGFFDAPFFMMLSTPACHAPFTPAPQYNASFSNISAPKTGSFNKYSKDTHWLVRSVKHPMGKASLDLIEKTYKNRWRTLLSVDDMVEGVVGSLKKKGLLDNTYIFFSSDNGYHLGQLSLPYDKRQLYEFDVRVPLMVRGPGIQPGLKRNEITLNIDFAPTFIDLAGLKPPSTMDGQSFVQLLKTNKTYGDSWRQDFMVEHSGEVQKKISGCPSLNNQGVAECFPDCVCEDAYNNTYACVRTISKNANLVYCEFDDNENFVEVYDLHKDPAQLTNIAKTIDPKILVNLNKRLVELTVCDGASCKPQQPWPPHHNLRYQPPSPHIHPSLYERLMTNLL